MHVLRLITVLLLAFSALALRTAVRQASIVFSVADNTTVTDSTLNVSVSVCGADSPLKSYDGTVYYKKGSSSVFLSDGPAPNCPGGTGDAWITDVPLKSGLNNFVMTVVDNFSVTWRDTLKVTYNPPPPPPQPIVVVSPDSGVASMPPGVGAQQQFSILNDRTGSRTYTFTVWCNGSVICGAAPSAVTFTEPGIKTVSASYSVSGAIGATGLLRLTATESGDGANTDQGEAAVTVLPSGPNLDRSLCLTLAAGPSAGVECGDLRLGHTLPAVRTINSVRAPTLTYAGLQAHPYPIVSIVATVPAPDAIPDSVVTTVLLGGRSYRRKVLGSAFLPKGTARRAMVAIDSVALSTTGLYDYTIEVRRFTGLSSAVLASGTGSLPIVNRYRSPFGAGWWLAGFEQLQVVDPARVLWIGGDGSTKVYYRIGSTAQDTIYVATRITHPDTLFKKTSDGTWRRALRSGGWIGFNALGKHVSTNGRTEFSTLFEYDGNGRLWKITVPPASALLTYQFAYGAGGDTAKVSSVSVADSTVGVNRTTALSIDGSGRLTAITDPGAAAVTFGYDPTVTRRITSRIDRRGFTTSFAYDQAHRLTSSKLILGATDSIHVTLCAGESAGLTTCSPSLVTPTDVRTVVDGARRDSMDVTTFWLDEFGAPSRIQDAHGSNTWVAKADARFPALPTRTQTVDGRIMGAVYDHRGNLLVATDSSHSRIVGGVTIYARTQYEWDAKWNLPTRVISPEGPFVRASYDATTGVKLWEEDARGVSSRTSFVYYTANNLLRAVVRPAVAPDSAARDSLAYDALRLNVAATVTLLGKRTLFTTDRLGRVTQTRNIIISGTDSAQKVTVSYDRLGRVLRQVLYGPLLNGQPAQSITVDNSYDDESNLLSITRSVNPDTTQIGSLTTSWGYDRAGRQVVSVSSDAKRDSTIYDPAGNAVERITRRGHTVTMRYDAMNRITRRILQEVNYPAYRLGAADVNPDAEYNPPYGGMTIPKDSNVFVYDVVGRIAEAWNSDSRILRTYNSFGALGSDTLWIKTWARDAERAYGVSYEYDLNARTTNVVYPAHLVVGTQGRTNYVYDATTGFLKEVRGLQNELFTLTYNARSELAQVVMPGNIIESNVFNADGLLRLHRIQNGASTSAPTYYPFAWIDSTMVTYDPLGRMLTAKNVAGPKDTTTAVYTGLGHLRQHTFTASGTGTEGNTLAALVDESFRHDPLGNTFSSVEWFSSAMGSGLGSQTPGYYGFAGTSDEGGQSWRANTYQAGTGRITEQFRLHSSGSTQQLFQYDDAGNTTWTSITSYAAVPYNNEIRDDRVSYYDAAGVLRAAERRQHIKEDQLPWYPDAFMNRVSEAYRYDPLGRRILVHEDSDCHNYAWPDKKPVRCALSALRRTIWSGDQELVEINRPVAGMSMPGLSGGVTVAMMESDTSTLILPPRTVNEYDGWLDVTPHYGWVAYTQGLEIDRPLSVTRFGYGDRKLMGWDENNPTDPALHLAWGPFTVVPHWNVRGEASTGTFATGAPAGAARYFRSHLGETREALVGWPLGGLAYGRLAPNFQVGWQGTVIQQKRDGVGTLYRRNRQYDPSTGRFTQEDPIGLAGGLNLYGYAGGDPINFSDPFGLCPDSVKTEKGDCPGGLSTEEWDKVENAANRCLAGPARDRIVTSLYDGRIRGANLGRVPGKVRRTSPDVIRLNRNGRTGDGAFSTDAYGLARILAHEDRHVQQLRELDWVGLYASGTSFAFMDALEKDAHGYATAQNTECKP